MGKLFCPTERVFFGAPPKSGGFHFGFPLNLQNGIDLLIRGLGTTQIVVNWVSSFDASWLRLCLQCRDPSPKPETFQTLGAFELHQLLRGARVPCSSQSWWRWSRHALIRLALSSLSPDKTFCRKAGSSVTCRRARRRSSLSSSTEATAAWPPHCLCCCHVGSRSRICACRSRWRRPRRQPGRFDLLSMRQRCSRNFGCLQLLCCTLGCCCCLLGCCKQQPRRQQPKMQRPGWTQQPRRPANEAAAKPRMEQPSLFLQPPQCCPWLTHHQLPHHGGCG